MPQSDWQHARDADRFFALVQRVRRAPSFEREERDYKLQVAAQFRRAKDAVLGGGRGWRAQLLQAINDKENNILDWRDAAPLRAMIESRSDRFERALSSLWAGTGPLPTKVDSFGRVLADAGLGRPGAQLTIASMLLMGSGARDHPPIRTQPFQDVFERVGIAQFAREATPGARYAYAISFLDALIDGARARRIDVRDRLDAQSIVWWMRDGWEPDDDDADLDAMPTDVEEIASTAHLTPTQREALVQARRGQGRYREAMLELWGGCAVTGCRTPQLLRASHLKPWRAASDAERVNPYNGLLLVPTLDVALDCGLITFRDDGRILLAHELRRRDRRILGIAPGMRLRYAPTRRHRPFLTYHRERIFLG